MAKLIKFPLAMGDGTKARSIEELREHSDVASIATYFEDGRLQRWLLANYLDDEAKEVEDIKQQFDSENKKIKVQNIHKLYEALELGKVDEKEIYAYLENQPEVKTDTVSFEVEDDSSVKEELKKHIYPDTKLEDWSISFEEVDDNNQFVQLLNKESNLYASYKIKKDNNTYSRIAFLIYQMEKSENLRFDIIMNLRNEILSGESIVHFGKYDWNIVKTEGKQALLLCTSIVKKMIGGRRIIDWLNSDFVNNSFSEDETSLLVDTPRGKVFLPSERDIELIPASERCRCSDSENQIKYWWLSNSTVVDKRGNIIPFYDEHSLNGVVPAIIVTFDI